MLVSFHKHDFYRYCSPTKQMILRFEHRIATVVAIATVIYCLCCTHFSTDTHRERIIIAHDCQFIIKCNLQCTSQQESKYNVHKNRLVAWHSGRMSVSGRRTFPVLRSTCSWWVATNVGKPSAIGQPTRPTQPFILSGSIKWVVSWNQMCAAVCR